MGSKTARLAFAIPALIVCCVIASAPVGAAEKPTKLKIIASLFPQYDFARRIAGERAEVRLLLPPGAESHSFEPTPGDMRDIADADVFLYTGEHMEPWAKRLAAAAAPDSVAVVDVSEGVEHMHDEDDAGKEHKHVEGDGHYHETDPHIWLNPAMAGIMAENVAKALIARDGANAAEYEENAAALRARIEELDARFRETVKKSPRRLLVFGERFAFAYFFEQYGLKMAGAYKDCAPGAEPGLKAVIATVETMRREDVKYVYLEDSSTGRISELLRAETGAEILRVDSLHNPPLERQRTGEGYVEIMRANMDAFAKGLQ